MALKLHNTLSRKKELFVSSEKNKVKMYVCGPTVYNYISIGNARPVIVFNMVRNYLKYLGYEVLFVQNITDIEDKIINKANEEGVDYKIITERYIKAFLEDLNTLEIDSIDEIPFATGMINEIIDIITRIINNDYGYVAGGNVYFDVFKDKNYGKLSGQKIDEMKDSDDGEFEKRNKIDFALWKKAKPGEPSWDSPWGRGRPGWHIECSAMAYKYLGFGFDIHGGGIDLIFPHHENEIAQSEAAFPEKGNFVKYWMHNGMIEVRERKMSKSDGLQDDWILKNLLKKFSANVIKFYILSTHYRSPLEFSGEKLEESQKAFEKITNTVRNIQFIINKKDAEERESRINNNLKSAEDKRKLKYLLKSIKADFISVMDDDFNSAGAIGILFEAIKTVNGIIQAADFIYDKEFIHDLNNFYNEITGLYKIFGIDPAGAVKKDLIEHAAETGSIEASQIDKLIQERNEARSIKDFKKSDEIRSRLLKAGIILEDRKDGTIWKIQK
ncbi:MAG: cysteine--tRNA ligase [Actinobacteria bacterium]|nr:cysteine--tRNA ligase [Actinomycetota bacterium]